MIMPSKSIALVDGNSRKEDYMSTITSFCMFFLSFVPLWVSILFIDFMSLHHSQANPWTEIISISLITVVSLISIIVLLRVLCVPKGADCIADYKIVEINEEKKISTEYLLSYILPLFAFQFDKWTDVVTFLIFFPCLDSYPYATTSFQSIYCLNCLVIDSTTANSKTTII